jgi:uncharacterized protein YdeI (YjbR/CyaY-like superfamily)
MKPRFFKTPDEFRAWLEKHHASEPELLVGFHKVGSGKPSMTWPQSVDEALSFGWIDGVRRRVDDAKYTIRFTPRKPTSIWSAVNIRRVAELTAQGRMRPAGLAAFARRTAANPEGYSFERNAVGFDEASLAMFRAKKTAWTHFEAQAPYYKRVMAHWVMSAKRPETREKRLRAVIAAALRGQRVDLTAPFAHMKNAD